jgi:ABC-2 type transport system permease protein
MTDKEFRVRYKNTLFGFLWIVINPLLQMFVIGFIFRFFIKDPIPNYYLYLLTGLLVWNFFSLSISKTTPLIVNERTLIKKAKFPKEVLPLSVILSNFIHLLIAFALLIIPVVYIGAFNISNILSLFEGLILLITFTIGFGMLTAALDVRFRDINFFVQAMLIIWFYATPIVYSINVVPYRLMWIWRINPMTSITQLLQNFFISAPGPGIGMLISNISIIFVISIVGIIVFKSESKNFDDWV